MNRNVKEVYGRSDVGARLNFLAAAGRRAQAGHPPLEGGTCARTLRPPQGDSLPAGLILALAACSSGGGGGGEKGTSAGPASRSSQGEADTCNSGDTKAGGTFTYVIEKNIQPHGHHGDP